jgi:hypothetical protein
VSAARISIPAPRTFEVSSNARRDTDGPAEEETPVAHGSTASASAPQPGPAQAQSANRLAGPSLPIDGSEVALRVLFAQAANQAAPPAETPAPEPVANAPAEGEPAAVAPAQGP